MSNFHIYPLATLAAAVVQWVIGAFWYGVAFKKRWLALVGPRPNNTAGRGAVEMVYSFILSLVLSLVLVNVIVGLGNLLMGGIPGFRVGAAIGVLSWLGFVASPMLTQHIYERRPANLFAINAGYWVVALAFSGGVAAVLLK